MKLFLPLFALITMELIPVIYLFLCYLLAASIGNTRKVGFWGTFLMSIFITPVLTALIIVWMPTRNTAYCMCSFRDFQIGQGYFFKKIISRSAERKIIVYNASSVVLTEEEFNQHFSIVLDNSTKESIKEVLLKVFK